MSRIAKGLRVADPLNVGAEKPNLAVKCSSLQPKAYLAETSLANDVRKDDSVQAGRAEFQIENCVIGLGAKFDRQAAAYCISTDLQLDRSAPAARRQGEIRAEKEVSSPPGQID